MSVGRRSGDRAASWRGTAGGRGYRGRGTAPREPPAEVRRHRVGLLVTLNYNDYYRSKLFQNERTRNSGCALALSLPRKQVSLFWN